MLTVLAELVLVDGLDFLMGQRLIVVRGMYPCQDGGTDDFSAYAGYSGTDSTTEMYAPVDSRLITNEIDLTGYFSAFIEFTEAYTYPEDANDSNMVEVSIDGGVTWDVVFASDPIEVGEDFFANGIDISEYVGNTIHIAFRYYDSVWLWRSMVC